MLSPRGKKELKINQRRILINSIEIGIPAPEQVFILGQRHTSNEKIIGRVRNSKTLNYKSFTPHRDGLFCERIFGPVQSYICACGKQGPYTTSKGTLKFCPRCEVEYTDQRARRYRVGYIGLVSPVTHIWHLKGRPSYLSLFLGKRKKTLATLAYCNDYLVEQAFSKVAINDALSFAKQHRGILADTSGTKDVASQRLERSESSGATFFKNRILKGLKESLSLKGYTIKRQSQRGAVKSKGRKGLTLSREQENAKVWSSEAYFRAGPFDTAMRPKALRGHTFDLRACLPPEIRIGKQAQILPSLQLRKVEQFDKQNKKCLTFLNSLRVLLTPEGSNLSSGGAISPSENLEALNGELSLTFAKQKCAKLRSVTGGNQAKPKPKVSGTEDTLKLLRIEKIRPSKGLTFAKQKRAQSSSSRKRSTLTLPPFSAQVKQEVSEPLLGVYESTERQQSDTLFYTRSHTLPFLPTFICEFHLRDGLLSFFDTFPPSKDIPIPVYCKIPRRYPLRDVHKFMADQAFSKVQLLVPPVTRLPSGVTYSPEQQAEQTFSPLRGQPELLIGDSLKLEFGNRNSVPSKSSTKSFDSKKTLLEEQSQSRRSLFARAELLFSPRGVKPEVRDGANADSWQIKNKNSLSTANLNSKMRVVADSSQLCLLKREVGLINRKNVSQTVIGTINEKKLCSPFAANRAGVLPGGASCNFRLLSLHLGFALAKGRKSYEAEQPKVCSSVTTLREVLLSLLLGRVVTTLIGLAPSLSSGLNRSESLTSKSKVLVGAKSTVVMARRVGSQLSILRSGNFRLLSKAEHAKGWPHFSEWPIRRSVLSHTKLRSFLRRCSKLSKAEQASESKLPLRSFGPQKRGFNKSLKKLYKYGKVKRLNALLHLKYFALAKSTRLLSQSPARFLADSAAHEQSKMYETESQTFASRKLRLALRSRTPDRLLRATTQYFAPQRKKVSTTSSEARLWPAAKKAERNLHGLLSTQHIHAFAHFGEDVVSKAQLCKQSKEVPKEPLTFAKQKCELDQSSRVSLGATRQTFLLCPEGASQCSAKLSKRKPRITNTYYKSKIVSQDFKFKCASGFSLPVIGKSPIPLTIQLVFADGWSNIGSLSQAWLANPYQSLSGYRLDINAGTAGQDRVLSQAEQALFFEKRKYVSDTLRAKRSFASKVSPRISQRQTVPVLPRFCESVEDWLEYWFDHWLQNRDGVKRSLLRSKSALSEAEQVSLFFHGKYASQVAQTLLSQGQCYNRLEVRSKPQALKGLSISSKADQRPTVFSPLLAFACSAKLSRRKFTALQLEQPERNSSNRFVGSRRLRTFDSALVSLTFACSASLSNQKCAKLGSLLLRCSKLSEAEQASETKTGSTFRVRKFSLGSLSFRKIVAPEDRLLAKGVISECLDLSSLSKSFANPNVVMGTPSETSPQKIGKQVFFKQSNPIISPIGQHLCIIKGPLLLLALREYALGLTGRSVGNTVFFINSQITTIVGTKDRLPKKWVQTQVLLPIHSYASSWPDNLKHNATVLGRAQPEVGNGQTERDSEQNTIYLEGSMSKQAGSEPHSRRVASNFPGPKAKITKGQTLLACSASLSLLHRSKSEPSFAYSILGKVSKVAKSNEDIIRSVGPKHNRACYLPKQEPETPFRFEPGFWGTGITERQPKGVKRVNWIKRGIFSSNRDDTREISCPNLNTQPAGFETDLWSLMPIALSNSSVVDCSRGSYLEPLAKTTFQLPGLDPSSPSKSSAHKLSRVELGSLLRSKSALSEAEQASQSSRFTKLSLRSFVNPKTRFRPSSETPSVRPFGCSASLSKQKLSLQATKSKKEYKTIHHLDSQIWLPKIVTIFKILGPEKAFGFGFAHFCVLSFAEQAKVSKKLSALLRSKSERLETIVAPQLNAGTRFQDAMLSQRLSKKRPDETQKQRINTTKLIFTGSSNYKDSIIDPNMLSESENKASINLFGQPELRGGQSVEQALTVCNFRGAKVRTLSARTPGWLRRDHYKNNLERIPSLTNFRFVVAGLSWARRALENYKNNTDLGFSLTRKLSLTFACSASLSKQKCAKLGSLLLRCSKLSEAEQASESYRQLNKSATTNRNILSGSKVAFGTQKFGAERLEIETSFQRLPFAQAPFVLPNQTQDDQIKSDVFFSNEDVYGNKQRPVLPTFGGNGDSPTSIDHKPERNRKLEQSSSEGAAFAPLKNELQLSLSSRMGSTRTGLRTDSGSEQLSKVQLQGVENNALDSAPRAKFEFTGKGGTDSYMKAQLDLQAIQEVLSYTGGGALREVLRCFDTQAFSVIILNEIKLLREYHKGYFLYEYDQVSRKARTRAKFELPPLVLSKTEHANSNSSVARVTPLKTEGDFAQMEWSNKAKENKIDNNPPFWSIESRFRQIESKNNYDELPEEINRFSRAIHRNARRLKIVQLLMRNKRRPEWMLISALPVLPPDLRPILQMSENMIVASDLNTLYQRVIYRNNRQYKLRIVEWSYATSLQRLVQDAVDRLIENGKGGSKPFLTPSGRPLKSLSDTLKGKKGRFRLNLLGKRVDFSGRSVIVVSPYLKIHECGLPREMALELYQYLLIRQLLLKRQVSSVILAKRVIRQQKALVWDTLRELIYHHPLLLNRAPTLHRLGIQAFQPKLVLGSTILLHPLVCAGFNADFDGDQMGVHLPLCDEARAEAWDLLWSRNNLLSPATGEPILLPSQDMVLGFYHMTALLPPQHANSTTQTASSARAILRRADKIGRHRSYGFVQIADCSAQLSTSTQVRTPLLLEKGLQKSHFFSPLDVVRVYQNGDLDIHTPVWLQWKGKIENNDSHQTPLELRINSFGVSTQLYPSYKYRKDISSKSIAIFNLFIRTTPGRVIVNNMFLACPE